MKEDEINHNMFNIKRKNKPATDNDKGQNNNQKDESYEEKKIYNQMKNRTQH